MRPGLLHTACAVFAITNDFFHLCSESDVRMKTEKENGGEADDWWKIKKKNRKKNAREQEEISEGKVSGRLLEVRAEIHEKYIFKKRKKCKAYLQSNFTFKVQQKYSDTVKPSCQTNHTNILFLIRAVFKTWINKKSCLPHPAPTGRTGRKSRWDGVSCEVKILFPGSVH